jgi:MYXO-CTERM domain-containing protein
MAVPPAFGSPMMPIHVSLITADYSMISPQASSLTQMFTLTDGTGTFESFDNSGMLTGLRVDQLIVNITGPVMMGMAPATVNANTNMLLTFTDTTSSSYAKFQITNATIASDFTPGSAVTVTGLASFPDQNSNTFDPNNVDLSAFSRPGGSLFTAVFEGFEATNTGGSFFLSWSPQVPVTGSVTITPPAAVPEPSSLAAWGVMALAVLRRLRRRRS